eukprot:SAG31_NODE_1723_length_7441_cov_12.555026_6_plen_46_part_00
MGFVGCRCAGGASSGARCSARPLLLEGPEAAERLQRAGSGGRTER